MPGNQPPEGSAARLRLVSNALWLVSVSVLRRPVRHCLGDHRAAEPQPAAALASGSRPGTSDVILIAAGVFPAVLAPSACAKRRLGRRMAGRALHGDGTLSGIGAATSLPALTALALYDILGWRQADRAAALIAAAKAQMWRSWTAALSPILARWGFTRTRSCPAS